MTCVIDGADAPFSYPFWFNNQVRSVWVSAVWYDRITRRMMKAAIRPF